MTIKIGQLIAQVSIPARTVSTPQSELDKALDSLEIGQGIEVVVKGKDGKQPSAKNQYSRIDSKKWAPKGKTFKVFASEDQSDVEEDEARFTFARVEFVEPRVRAKKSAAPAVDAGADEAGADEAGADE